MGEQTGSTAAWTPCVAPPEPTYGPVLTIEVDGEANEFRPDGRGGTRYDWLSGPNDADGFTNSPTENCSLDDHRGFIRNFLDLIDTAIGFMGTDPVRVP